MTRLDNTASMNDYYTDGGMEMASSRQIKSSDAFPLMRLTSSRSNLTLISWSIKLQTQRRIRISYRPIVELYRALHDAVCSCVRFFKRTFFSPTHWHNCALLWMLSKFKLHAKLTGPELTRRKLWSASMIHILQLSKRDLAWFLRNLWDNLQLLVILNSSSAAQ